MKSVRLGPLSITWKSSLGCDPVAGLIGWLPETEEAADVTIDLQATDIVHRPDPAWGAPLFLHNKVELYIHGGINTVFDQQSKLTFDAEASRLDGLIHPTSSADLTGFTRVTLLLAFAAAMRLRGLYHLHAGGVVLDGRGILIVGDGGMGKSSTTLALVAAGADCLSDDVLFVAATDQTCFGLPAPLRLSPEIHSIYPSLASGPISRAEDGKIWVDFRGLLPGKFTAAAPAPHIILLPRISAEEPTHVVPTEKAEALGRMLVSSAWVTSERLPLRDAQMNALARLVDQATCYELVLGPDAKSDWNRVGKAVRSVI